MNNIYKKTIKGVHLPKTELGEEKLQKIVAAAEKKFIEKNFYNTSIIDICKEAGVAVGTFYIYFDDKLSVYRLLVQMYRYEIQDAIAEALADVKGRREIEKQGIKAFINYAYNKPNVYNILWGSLSVDKKIFFDYYMSFAESYIKQLSKSSSVESNIDITTLAYVLMGISNFVGLQAIFEGNYDEEKIEQLVDKAMVILDNRVFTK